ncbi:MAG: hypothetical protein KatS3mg011_2378 [Acidimicrobiia bacterium]|nr:MAG: hypothetical protein KatS3mg011_2378 [Acidimicrobiia bacterium]
MLDRRPVIFLPDGGLPVHSRLSAWNAAAALLAAVDRPDEAAGRAFNCADSDQYSLRQWVEMTMELAGGELEIVGVPGDLPSPAWATMVFHYSGSPHVIVDTTSIRQLLGYRDAVPAREGLARTVRWIIEHRHEAHTWSVLDPFDYAAEDAFLAAWRQAHERLTQLGAPWANLSMPLPQTAKGKPA